MVGFFQCYMLVDPRESFFCGRRYRRCPWSVAFPGAEALVLEDWDPRNVRNHEDSDDTYLGNRVNQKTWPFESWMVAGMDLHGTYSK